jgi:molybdenum cofactor cytidylyltransferase
VLVKHFRNPLNRGSLKDATISQEGSNPLCGDRVRIDLQINGRVVSDARFTANACALCVAAASVLTELVKGAPLDEVDTLTVDDLLRSLDAQVPAARVNCIRLPLTVMHTGVMLYRRASGLPEAARARPVAVIILAAGMARRFGAQKLLAPFAGSNVLRTVVDSMTRAAVEHVIVVSGPDGEALKAACAGVSLTWARNDEPGKGMSASIVRGIEALPPNVGAAIVALGDQPTVSSQVVDRLVATWRGGGGPIVAPRYRGVRGNPVLFDRAMFGALRFLQGDRGARDLLESEPNRVIMVDMPEAPPLDVDTLSDYDELLRRAR